MTTATSIGPYEYRQAELRAHDPRAAEVARRVGELIEARLTGCTLEHIGSTSVPGLAGKGIVDLMLLYPPGGLTVARDALDAAGFQRQTARDPFPEERPMRVGSVDLEGARFQLHVHVIAAGAPEAAQLRAFRDRLRADPSFRDAYVARKRAVLASGVTDSLEYCYQKGDFIQNWLRTWRAAACPERLETARLVLTRPVPEDLPDLNAMHSDPRVMATLGGLRTAEELEAMNERLFAAWRRDGFAWWIARNRTDGGFVGRGGLRRIEINGRDEVELAYGLAAAFWRQGLASEIAAASVRVGFELLDLEELICFTLKTNVGSRRVMEKAGFRFEREGEHSGLPHVFFRLRRAEWARGVGA